MLIDISYFNTPSCNIPNTTYPDVSDLVNSMIKQYEPSYLEGVLGYGLSSALLNGLQEAEIPARFLDILFGKEYTDGIGFKRKWKGLVSITDEVPSIQINPAPSADVFITVGVDEGLINGEDTYSRPEWASKNIRVTQQGFGPLEQLKSDGSNEETADIEILEGGGFRLLNGIKFSQGNKFQIEFLTSSMDISAYDTVQVKESPIADYVMFQYHKYTATLTSGLGEVKPEGETSITASPKQKQCFNWNRMALANRELHNFLSLSYSVYPEYQINMLRNPGWIRTINVMGL